MLISISAATFLLSECTRIGKFVLFFLESLRDLYTIKISLLKIIIIHRAKYLNSTPRKTDWQRMNLVLIGRVYCVTYVKIQHIYYIYTKMREDRAIHELGEFILRKYIPHSVTRFISQYMYVHMWQR